MSVSRINTIAELKSRARCRLPRVLFDYIEGGAGDERAVADASALRDTWRGRLVLKGIMHLDDTVEAAATGADGIIVSNHGGRQSDRLPSPLQVLPDIVRAAGDRLTVMVDGGITSGADVVVALIMGAKFVFSGRSVIWVWLRRAVREPSGR